MSTLPATSLPLGAGPARALDRAFGRTGSRTGGRAGGRARLAVVPRRRVRAARMPFVTLVSLVLLAGVVGLLCFNTQMQQASFAETKLQAQADTLSAREQTLHDQVQALRDPQHLAQAAQRSGMVIPETACTLELGTGVTDSTCTAATNASTPPLDGPAPGKPAVIDPAPQVTVVQAAPATATGTGPAAIPAAPGNARHRAHHRHNR